MEYSLSDRELERLKHKREDQDSMNENIKSTMTNVVLTDDDLQKIILTKRKRSSYEKKSLEKRARLANARTLPFIVYTNGRYELSEEAVKMIEKIDEPFAIIAVVGKYRTGKSFFLNRVLLENEGSNAGFTVGSSIQACTKGLWVYSETVMCRDKSGKQFPALIVDTEGISALDADSTHDTRVFSLALLLSSYFIYNSTGAIDEEAINNLSLVVKVSDHLRLSASKSSSKNLKNCKDNYFPSFLWVVRDFTLRLLNAEGKPITETQYLEDALKISGNPSDDKNRVRECLQNFFPTRDCRTMVRPVEDEAQLQELDKCANSELRSCFMEQVLSIREHVLSHAAPKSIDGHEMNGKLFIKMCDAYTKAINRGAAPAIRNTWLLLSESQCRSAMEESLEVAKKRLVLQKMPVQMSTLIDVIRMAREEAIDDYRRKAFGDETSRFLNRLEVKIDKLEKQLKDQNEAVLKTKIMSQQAQLCNSLSNVESFQELRLQYNNAYTEFSRSYPGFEGSWAICASEKLLWELIGSFYSNREKVSKKECFRAKEEMETAQSERKKLQSHTLELQKEIDQLTSSAAEASRQLKNSLTEVEAIKVENCKLEDHCKYLKEKAEADCQVLRSELNAAKEEIKCVQERFRNEMLERIKQVNENTSEKEQQFETKLLEILNLKKKVQELSEELEASQKYGLSMEEKLTEITFFSQKNEELTELLEISEKKYKSAMHDLEELEEKHKAESTSFRKEALQTINDIKNAQSRERVTFISSLENAKRREEKLQEDADSKYEILQQQYERTSNQLSRCKTAAEVASNDTQKTIDGLRAEVSQLKNALSSVRQESAETIKKTEEQWREQLLKTQASLNAAQDSHLRTCMELQQNLHSAESRAQCAETRVEEYVKQLHEARTNPEYANLKTQARELKTSLERAEIELKWVKNSKEKSVTRLTETQERVRQLEKTCKQLESVADKEVTSLKLAYERKISILETRISEKEHL